jgi:2-haloacid dehalogenase
LFDVLRPLLERSGSSWSREEALNAYLTEEHKIEAETPSMLYSTIVSSAVSRVASQLGTTLSGEEKDAAGASVGKWAPWPDTVAALERLSKYYKLVILSNVDLNSFSHTKKLLEHGFIFDKILTAQEIGSYKPDTNNFLYMLNVAKEEFGVPKEQVLVTAQSLMHDHVPANKLGLASSWIQRREGMGHAEGVKWTFKFPTLAAMADALESELAEGKEDS